MSNPYRSTIHETSDSHKSAVLPRFAALVIYLLLWGCVVYGFTAVITALIGEVRWDTIENRRNLTSLQSLYFYARDYWFVALFFSIPVNLVLWKMLRIWRNRNV